MAWYKDPVMITEGKMQYLFDQTGRRYLDVRDLCTSLVACTNIVSAHTLFAAARQDALRLLACYEACKSAKMNFLSEKHRSCLLLQYDIMVAALK